MDSTSVSVRVAGELTIALGDLPPNALAGIKSALTITNEDREKAASIKQFGWWDMPETIALWRTETHRGGAEVLCLPRGFASQLVAGLEGLGITVEWDDHRTRVPSAEGYYKLFTLRDYQLDAVIAILRAEQGVYKAPTGSGKTVTALATMAYASQRTLVIVDKVGLANQWRVRGHQFYDMPLEKVEREDGTTEVIAPLTKGDDGAREVGLIGKGVWEERELTVCLRQTLHERAWQLDATGWWQQWGSVWYDECHHLSAETLGDVSRKVTSWLIPGISATPAKSEMKGAIVRALVGPIIHETPEEILYERGVLMKPVIEVNAGEFFAHFHNDHTSDHEGNCEAEGCTKSSKHSHRNNYSSVVKKLVEDPARNARIAERIMLDRGHVHLVSSDQLKHLKLIKAALIEAGWPEDKIWMLRGEENARGEDQKIVQELMAADEGVVLSTVAKEALDIPPIDRVHIVFPMRDRGNTIQLIGRAKRTSPGKKDAVIIDYREPQMDVLEGQFAERDHVYRQGGYKIVTTQGAAA